MTARSSIELPTWMASTSSIARPAPAGAPKLLLLHGFPTLEPHVPGPDPAPGRPLSHRRSRFAGVRKVRHAGPRPHVRPDRRDSIDRFTEVVGFDRYAVYVFDYGAPTGFRLAVRHPDRITAIISQNGNAYEEGLSDGWNPIRAYWQDASQANREALRRVPETRDDRLAIHARRSRRDGSLSGRILAR